MNNLRSCSLTLLAAACLSGCVTNGPGQRLVRAVERSGVVDASARRLKGMWFLRFDALLLSDLDEAIDAGANGDDARMRALATTCVGHARALADRVQAGEIARLPAAARQAIAAELRSSAAPEALRQAFHERGDAAWAELRRDWETRTPTQLRRQLRNLRRKVEPLPDDRGRALRQIAFAWGAIPTWIGLGREERQAVPKTLAKLDRRFARSATWRLDPSAANAGNLDPLLVHFAPMLVVEQPPARDYTPEDDRIGRVRLTGSPDSIRVHVDTTDPVLYAYRNEAKLNGKRYVRLIYTWWFPERPVMVKDDPSAGHIDGGTLRITLDAEDRPALAEVMLNCGCEHRVFVADRVEGAARRAFGAPLAGKRFAVERDVPQRYDVIVADTFELSPTADRLTLYLSAGYHEVCRIEAGAPAALPPGKTAESRDYVLSPYDTLVNLPLGKGRGSMFGPDGLVHHAGRREGYLLAPTGILSAGQPRQRGTQRVRWDTYLFDDPHLLERTLRLPPTL